MKQIHNVGAKVRAVVDTSGNIGGVSAEGTSLLGGSGGMLH